jgi:putative membrane protein
MLIKLALRTTANAGAIYFANSIVDGFTFSGNFVILIAIALALALFHSFVYPVIKILAFPLAFLSFGLFGTIINIVVLWGIAQYVPQLTIDGLMPLIWATAILSLANLLFSWL